MKKIKRLMALVATGLLAVQMLGMLPASASGTECDFSSDSLEITLDTDDVDLYIDDEMLSCYDYNTATEYEQALRTIKSITVEMDDEQDSTGELWISVSNDYGDSESTDWPRFSSFDIDVTTELNIDADDVTGTGNGSLRLTVGSKSISFNGTSATFTAPSVYVEGSYNRDSIDASGASVPVEVYGYGANDLIKGGSGRDYIEGGDDADVIYGNGGNDYLDGGDDDGDYCWAGAGDDYIYDCQVAAPGAGDDDVESSDRVSYADLTEGIEWTNTYGDISTGGAAGDDLFDTADFERLYGSQGDDVILDDDTDDLIFGLGGNDVIKIADGAAQYGVFGGDGDDMLAEAWIGDSYAGYGNYFYGGPGNDTIKALGGADSLNGGAGRDKLNGGGERDNCRQGEVLVSCERIVVG